MGTFLARISRGRTIGQVLAYTLTVTGPEAPARPVFHTRLTVKATPGSTVDVDAISMTTVDP